MQPLALLLALATAAAVIPPATAATVERQGVVMGTRLTMEVTAVDRASALRAAESAWRELEAADRRLSTWGDGGELERLNRSPVGEAFILSPELAADLAAAAECSRLTGGAFDSGIGSLVEAWGLRSGGRRPTAGELAAAREASGARHLQLSGRVASRQHPGLRVEEGGFGKGSALDRAAAALVAAGAEGWIDLGGQVVTTGERRVAIADPTQRQRPAVEIQLAPGSIATSGNAERGIVVDGTPRGHLLDPFRGEPARDFGSVTVWTPSAFAADCLATGLYVLGPERALALAEVLPEVEALVLVPQPGGGVRVEATSGLAGRWTALSSEVELRADASAPHRFDKEREQEATRRVIAGSLLPR